MLINLSTVAPHLKRPLWQALQADAPHLAALLQEAELRELVAHFDGAIHIDTTELPASALAVLNLRRSA